ncbi:MAG: ABC transporter ATP-binding protein [Gammaproteobacteria bacterium]|uniref:ABC transporter ATP-binding protein n=1 Tax=Pseudacidovorax sp. TaxID=1934311 RepID=UPI001B6DED3B|nr:ABC transporter ATP-binding protein [Pseudacidovorax sp.]MBP6895921.1 ABC transporter ATP-binding protein [Pseudacidovorax sp.]
MLEIRGLHASYGDSQALFGIDLRVPAGAGVALLGRNGAGKSTLMKSVLDAGPRTQGELRFNGVALQGQSTEARARMGLALVPEDRRLFATLTVRQNLELAWYAAPRDRPRMTVDAVVKLFPLLAPLLERLGDQLSGGQQQLVAVARGLMASPALLMLDEPAEGLAPKVANDLAREVRAARTALGLTVLVAEQSIAYARQCTEYVYLLDSGQIVFAGDWAAFDADPQLKMRYLAV